MSVALSEQGQTVKVKHSRHSLKRIGNVRDALALVHDTADKFAKNVARLTAQPVSNLEFRQVLDVLVPIEAEPSKRARTLAEDKRHSLTQLYRYDPRVAPWTGSEFGVLQAFNTWRHHEQNGLPAGSQATKARARADRNALRAITRETETEDAKVLRALADVRR